MHISVKREIKKRIQITTISCKVPGERGIRTPLRFAQLTDIHYGLTPLALVRRAVEFTNDLNPSAIFITGDFIQYRRFDPLIFQSKRRAIKLESFRRAREHARSLLSVLAEELNKLSATSGVYATLGNHDYHEGIRLIKSTLPDRFQWLVNCSTSLSTNNGDVYVYGLDDYKRGHPTLSPNNPLHAERLSRSKSACFRLLLTHNPDAVLDISSTEIRSFDLILAGHTHGGQICLPGGIPLVTRTNQRQHVRGLSYRENTAIFVSNGLGYGGLRLRTFCPPEIVVLDLLPDN